MTTLSLWLMCECVGSLFSMCTWSPTCTCWIVDVLLYIYVFVWTCVCDLTTYLSPSSSGTSVTWAGIQTQVLTWVPPFTHTHKHAHRSTIVTCVVAAWWNHTIGSFCFLLILISLRLRSCTRTQNVPERTGLLRVAYRRHYVNIFKYRLIQSASLFLFHSLKKL